MRFYDENNNIIDIENIEKPEQDLANKYILENDIVLELGARYGTVSCIINSKLINKLNQVVIEPDERVWNALKNNKSRNNCDFHIVEGFLGNNKMDLINKKQHLNGYGSTFIYNNDSKIKSFTMDEIKIKYNIIYKNLMYWLLIVKVFLKYFLMRIHYFMMIYD